METAVFAAVFAAWVVVFGIFSPHGDGNAWVEWQSLERHADVFGIFSPHGDGNGGVRGGVRGVGGSFWNLFPSRGWKRLGRVAITRKAC